MSSAVLWDDSDGMWYVRVDVSTEGPMKPSLCFVGVALMLCVALEPSSAQDLAFVAVNVVPMDRNAILNNRTVIVRDGRIADVGPAGNTRVPAGGRRGGGGGEDLLC